MAPKGRTRSFGNAYWAAAALCLPNAAFADNTPAVLRALTKADEQAAACVPESETCFTLTAVRIDGASIFTQAELAPLYTDKLTARVSMNDLVLIAEAVTQKYREQGYFLTRAAVASMSPQTGIATINVYEGRLSEIVVEGSGRDAVAPYLTGLDTSAPLRLADLDRRLARASDAPGVRLQSRIEPNLDNPALHRLVVKATLRPITADLFVDNRGSNESGPWESYARVALNSAFRPGDQLGLAVFTIPDTPKEYALLEGSYSAPISDASRLTVTAAASKSRDGADRASPEIGSEMTSVALQYSRALLRNRDAGLWADVSVQAKDVRQDRFGGAQYRDNLRVGRFRLRGFTRTDGAQNDFWAEVSMGLGDFGASKRAPGLRSRSDADGEFVKVRFRASRYQDISKYFGVYGSVEGQYAFDPLLSSEEMRAGGTPYGRAYDYSEISGDHGVAGTIELRAGFDPQIEPISFLQGYAFYDAADLWNLNKVHNERSLASAGVGLRVTIADAVNFRVEAAKPLTRTPEAEGDKDWRPFVALSASY